MIQRQEVRFWQSYTAKKKCDKSQMPLKCVNNFNGNTQTKDASFTLYVDFFEQNESFENKHKALFLGKFGRRLPWNAASNIGQYYIMIFPPNWNDIILKGLQRKIRVCKSGRRAADSHEMQVFMWTVESWPFVMGRVYGFWGRALKNSLLMPFLILFPKIIRILMQNHQGRAGKIFLRSHLTLDT